MKRAQSGMTIIETMGALAIASMLVLGLSAMIDTSMEDLEGQQAALHQAQVVGAARRYITENYATLVASSSAATIAVPIAQLKTARFLSNSFSDTNAYFQTPCLLVRQPSPGKLDVLIATYGGQAIPDRHVSMVAMQAGQGGGYITAANPGTARGASWEVNTTAYRGVTCNGTTVLTGTAANDGGHLVSSLFYDGPGQLAMDFLYRNAVPGRPELNQMNTPIKMANAGLVKSGDPCGADAAFSMDVDTRHLLACAKDGKWRIASSWTDSVRNYGNLPATGNTAGDVRMVTALNRAFTFNGSTWVALAVDQNGDMIVPRDVRASRNIDAGGTIHADGHISTDRDVNVGQDVRVGRDVRVQRDIYADRNIRAQNDITAEQMVYGEAGVEGLYVRGYEWVDAPEMQVWDRKNPGDRCHIPQILPDGTIGYIWPIGTFLLDSNSVLLICGNDKHFRYQNNTFAP